MNVFINVLLKVIIILIKEVNHTLVIKQNNYYFTKHLLMINFKNHYLVNNNY